MMKKIFLSVLVGFSLQAAADLAPGQPAPGFSVQDAAGKTHTLSENKGKWVVLEWLNHGCPFVRKHYDSNNMQTLQKTYTGKGVVWFSVISSAPGKQGAGSAKEVLADVAENKAVPTAVLLDGDGKVGKAYGAQTTPHMYVINPEGKVVYMGAIDDKATTEIADVKTAKNYVSAALDAGLAKQPIAVASTKAYGCSVKYKN